MRLKFEKGGRVKAVWDDKLALVYERAFGKEFASRRRRASLILTVEEGPSAGCFYADMSHLADITGEEEHRVCLWPPCRLESECKAAEVAYINARFIEK